ncbi:unnamed protein product [Paramecium pentaurelia]|uniref:Uncharacterized protein n=1 Tax=Paramecium pentaurelia TaxID=43138 RepID=A0A8S1U754_9CILI|nr:unnamed protein product [Paramecium pentaurelia]
MQIVQLQKLHAKAIEVSLLAFNCQMVRDDLIRQNKIFNGVFVISSHVFRLNFQVKLINMEQIFQGKQLLLVLKNQMLNNNNIVRLKLNKIEADIHGLLGQLAEITYVKMQFS